MSSNNKKMEDIVISGISGRFPESSTMEEFKQNLFNGIDLITEDDRRWPPNMYNLPKRYGKLKNVSHFDASFFGIPDKQAEQMDPQMRMFFEVTYEAIIDSGLNPNDLRGSRTGVYVGICSSDSTEILNQDVESFNGYGMLGCVRALIANRVSFAFDFKGPSCAVDTACSSSLFALQQAVMAMKNGECDAAIVGGVNLLLHPKTSVHFCRLKLLSPEGMCRTFDSSANGYVRSEAIAAVFLQKVSDAKRVYGTVLGVKSNTDGYKKHGILFPSGLMQNKLIRETYAENGINPLDVKYVEAHGTGTLVGDSQETNSIADFFCKNRKEPLLIGSVKSNMGHSEPVSGVCSLAKIAIAMESGLIPPNLNYKVPNERIPALIDGRIKVVTQTEKLPGDVIAVNSFGFGGVNAHAIIKAHNKKKLLKTSGGLPRVMGVSGRTEEAVQLLLDEINKNRNDVEFLGLIDQIHKNNINGHCYRGYSVLYETPISQISKVVDTKLPLWFVYSGMGSQWAQMGKNLMEIEVFRNSIEKSAKALKPHGFDLEWLLLNSTESTFDNILNSFVSITAMQIALTDVLKSLGLEPDGFVGHSMGELGCAYADGSLTTEQAVLASYFRGRAVFDTKLEPGSMAVVGLGWEKIQPKCPPEVVLACHNSADNITISGPQQTINKFIEDLTAENIFARKVKCGEFAFHSRHIAAAGPKLQEALNDLIPNPKPRTNRWISSSIPESSWDSSLAATSSGEYFVNNFLSPVLFHDALQHVPKNAIVVEIAPSGLMQTILKRTLDINCTNINLMKRNSEDNLEFLLTSLGKIYNAGAQPQLGKLYPPISFPVSTGTPMINSLVKWDHSTEWPVPHYTELGRDSEFTISIDLSTENDQYLTGHVIDGRVLFPATGYLALVWKIYAKHLNKNYEEMPVVIENLKIHRATLMPKKGPIKFFVNILKSCNEFQICESGSVVVTGKIHVPEDIQKETLNLSKPNIDSYNDDDDLIPLSNYDIYKEFRLRGYDYKNYFCGIFESDNKGTTGKLEWNNNWVCFMDTMLQFLNLGHDIRELYVPVEMQRITIDPIQHLEYIKQLSEQENKHIDVNVYKNIGVIKSGGIEFCGTKATVAPKRQFTHSPPKLEKYKFIPFENLNSLNVDQNHEKSQALNVLLQIVCENCIGALKIKLIEIGTEQLNEDLLAPTIKEMLENEFVLMVDATIFTSESVNLSNFELNGVKHVIRDVINNPIEQNSHLVIVSDILSQDKSSILVNIARSLKEGGFILLEETNKDINNTKLSKTGLEIVAIQATNNKTYVLLRKPVVVQQNSIVIQVTDKNYNWVESLKDSLERNQDNNKKIYLYVQGEELNGLVGMINCLLKEPNVSSIRSVFIFDKNAENFNLNKYEHQLRKDLVVNVFKNGVWGSFRHLLLDNNIVNRKIKVQHAYINTLTRGDLSSLTWIESPLTFNKEKESNTELCHVYYAPLNFRDIMLATGKLSADILPPNLIGQDCLLGMEFSGRDSKGRRVMGMTPAKSLASTVVINKNFLWEVPEKWSLEEAATVPVVYGTVYYALLIRGKMRKGETVLIHAGSGGVGLAAITICLHMGCKVFTTVGSEAKRDFLKKTFPKLTDNCIGNSRDASFEQLIRQQTNGKGVDLVLNCLASDLLQASIRCLANGGRFLEIGKIDMANNSNLGMNIFLKNVTFHGILLDALFDAEDPEKYEVIRLVSEGIKNGAVQPLPNKIFTENEIESAFRFMASGKHVGKVSIRLRNEETRSDIIPNPLHIPASPRTYFNSEKSYVLVGGLGGFGLELTNWMINRGATKLVLTSRSGVKTGYQSLCLRRWEELGVNIKVSITNCATAEETRTVLQEAVKLGPIGGIFNLAAVLRVALINQQSTQNFEIVNKPKFDATKHLDLLSRSMAPNLDHFVCFSSIASGRGSAGQSTYGFANSTMERICEKRQELGLPALAIQWGAIGDVGMYFDRIGGNDTEMNGVLPQRMSSCLATLDIFMQQPNAVVATMVLAGKHGKDADAKEDNLIDAVANILGIKDVSAVHESTSLVSLGMDSLMGAEIKQTLERNYDVVLSPQEVSTLTFKELFDLTSSGQNGDN